MKQPSYKKYSIEQRWIINQKNIHQARNVRGDLPLPMPV